MSIWRSTYLACLKQESQNEDETGNQDEARQFRIDELLASALDPGSVGGLCPILLPRYVLRFHLHRASRVVINQSRLTGQVCSMLFRGSEQAELEQPILPSLPEVTQLSTRALPSLGSSLGVSSIPWDRRFRSWRRSVLRRICEGLKIQANDLTEVVSGTLCISGRCGHWRTGAQRGS